MGWFESKYGEKARGRPTGVLEFETRETEKDSETMGGVPNVTDHAYIGKVVERLRAQWSAM